jgi:hypothetical protein
VQGWVAKLVMLHQSKQAVRLTNSRRGIITNHTVAYGN